MKKRSFLLLLVSLCLTNTGSARQDLVVCGTNRENAKEKIQLHRQSVRAQAKLGLRTLEAAPAAANIDIGNIAVLDDSGGVVARMNQFNLQSATVTFQPSAANAARYRFTTGGNTFDVDAAERGEKIDGLGDDDGTQWTLPFSFPFFGASYQKIFINSDGNLTFNQPDTASSDRSLGRVTSGPPRIAGLFRDLDPSRSSKGVYVLSEGGRFVVSWVQVPEFEEVGVGVPLTFQIRLFPDGKIEFAYGSILTDEAVVGISPGGLKGPTEVVSFVAGSSDEFSATVAERFGGSQEIDIVAAAQKFYQTHGDAYDYLVIFNNMGIAAASGAIAYEVTVRNDRSGYGDIPADDGREYGSGRRLQAVMNMGPLGQYLGVNDPVGGRGLITGDTPLTVLGHEAGHLFLAFASVRDAQNPSARPMLGAQLAHWSFNFNSEASLLEGNRIRDDGAGANPRFMTIATVEGYSPLDQYLMGFRAMEEVAATFLVTNSLIQASRLPQKGVGITGGRRDILVDEVAAVEGRRTPDYTVAQRRFRFAFLLIVPEGTEPTQAEIDKIETFRREFEPYYHTAASERAWADASLRRALQLSLAPASGVLVGASVPASVSIEQPAASNLTVALETQAGAASAPATVVIPAGATKAAFTITGLRTGVEELAARPLDEQYEAAYARVQVTPSLSGLTMTLVSGGLQAATPGTSLAEPVVVRAVDINRVPYPGVQVRASVTGGGSVTPSVATTDESGLVTFTWTPGAGPAFELTAVVDGVPASAVRVGAVPAPAFPAAGVVNAASYTTGLSPGGFASIFGVGLAAGQNSAALPPYPKRLSGVQVLVNGQPAALHYVSDAQVNFVVPTETATGTAQIVVTNLVGASAAIEVPVLAASPGVFFDAASGYGAVLISGTALTTNQRPAKSGEYIEIYCTGLGATQQHPTIPGVEETVLPVTVFLGNLSLPASFSGLSPSFPALYQVNVQIPAGLPPGDVKLAIEANGVRSNEVKIRVE
jgi:uncharacterized protein (TIGR03437 family)